MTSKSVVLLVIGFLGTVALVCIGGVIALSFVGKTVPDSLIALGSSAVGAIGGILAKTGTEPTETTVVNTSAQPVPTTDTIPFGIEGPSLGIEAPKSFTPILGGGATGPLGPS